MGKNSLLLEVIGFRELERLELSNLKFNGTSTTACMFLKFFEIGVWNVSLKMNNCSFLNCYAQSNHGGAIYASDKVNSTMNINNCYFENNYAANNGGIEYGFDGLIVKEWFIRKFRAILKLFHLLFFKIKQKMEEVYI